MQISDVRLPDGASLSIHPNVLLERPQLGLLISLIVATWADIEGRLEAICLLCTRDKNSVTELQSIKGWDARSKFFVQKVMDSQGDALAIELRAVLRHVAQAASKRHDIAHGIYAICKVLPDDLVIASPEIYTRAMEEALRADAQGSPRLLLNREAILATARVVTAAHLQKLVDELSESLGILHNFMIEKTPAIVQVHGREALPRAVEHPEIAKRIQNAKKGIKKRNRQRAKRGVSP